MYILYTYNECVYSRKTIGFHEKSRPSIRPMMDHPPWPLGPISIDSASIYEGKTYVDLPETRGYSYFHGVYTVYTMLNG